MKCPAAAFIESFSHKGRLVELRAFKEAGRWTWFYTIDGGPIRANSEELASSSATALDEARCVAIAAIDAKASDKPER